MSAFYDYMSESLKADIGKEVRKAKDDNKLKKALSVGLGALKHKSVEKEFTDNEIKDVKELEDKMRDTNSYTVYKPLFQKFCHLFDIAATVIFKINYKDNNTVEVQYDDMDKEVIVPNGSVLTHVSPNEFDELIPHFKGKQVSGAVSRGGYLYSTPRIYVTLGTNSGPMQNNIADIKSTAKVNKYTIPENIRTIKVDPAIPNTLNSGAGYIETNLPIKVKKVKDEDKSKEIKKTIATAAAGAAVGVAGSVAAKKLSDKIKESKTKPQHSAEESTNDIIDTKLAIYEAYEYNIISECEKNTLLEIIESDTSYDDEYFRKMYNKLKTEISKYRDDINLKKSTLRNMAGGQDKNMIDNKFHNTSDKLRDAYIAAGGNTENNTYSKFLMWLSDNNKN